MGGFFMERRSFLTSNGIKYESPLKEPFMDFLHQSGIDRTSASVAFISPHRQSQEAEEIKSAKVKNLKRFQFGNVLTVDLYKYTPHTIRNLLDEVQVVVLDGGDIYLEMSQIKQSGLNRFLTQYMDRNSLVFVAESAGSVLASRKGFEVAKYHPGVNKNTTGEEFKQGLDIVRNAAIWPHYRENHRAAFRKCKRVIGDNIVTLANGQAVVVTGRYDHQLYSEKNIVIGSPSEVDSKEAQQAQSSRPTKETILNVLEDPERPLIDKVRTAFENLSLLTKEEKRLLRGLQGETNFALAQYKRTKKIDYFLFLIFDKFTNQITTILQT